MAGFAEKISNQVRKDTSHHLIYPPGVPLALGDIVVRDAGIWIPIGNIATRAGITPEGTLDDTKDRWEAQSDRGVTFSTKAKLESNTLFKFVGQADAGVKVTLSGTSTYALGLKGARFERIAEVDEFWDQIRGAVPFWTWDLGRRIVTGLVRADSGTWLASASGESSFELQADADLPAGGVTSIADVAVGFTLKSTMSAKDLFVANDEVTPLFSAHKVSFLRTFTPAELQAEQPRIEESKLQEDTSDGDD